MPVAKNKLTFFRPDMESEVRIPFAGDGVSAGFPSPALDFMETSIDLNKALSENPLATFYIRVDGNSMVNAGIDDKDVLVVDRSLEPQNGKIAICYIDGGFTVKRIKLEKDGLWLMPENEKYLPIKVGEENQFLVWGIVTYVIKKL
jgi:DNA polymerase V